ncbi:transporter [Lithospermum erythrorhizon]|uniref:Transporter n=1 Tax=Lithospermum erythrorhizon TaxID=34254 RepID=A0AAV3RZT8_LITER
MAAMDSHNKDVSNKVHEENSQPTSSSSGTSSAYVNGSTIANEKKLNGYNCWGFWVRRKNIGGWSSAFLLLANQGLATLAFFGVGVNLVLFLTRVLDQKNAVAANNVSKWTGTVYLCSLIGAFLSDSYWGRYLTCAIFQVILILGISLLSFISWLLLINPQGCGSQEHICEPPTTLGTALFYLAIYLVALGYGGHQPTLATFGSDQFDESIPKQRASKASFFGYFYFALNVGSLFSNTVLVYYEDGGKWTIGFGASTIAAIMALVGFLLGSPGYCYVKASGNPLPRVAQVFVATVRKWKLAPPTTVDNLYEVDGEHSAIKGARKILHTEEFMCLDKAAIVTEDDRSGQADPWRLCTVTQIEEAKCIIRMLPIWLCTIIYSVIFTQMASLFVEQGAVMYANIGSFHFPAATMSAFDIFSVLICTMLYNHVLVPVASRISGNPKGISDLQRMGVGLIIGLLSMVAAGVTEIFRLKQVVPGQEHSNLSIFWQVPQYVLVGASEVFMYVGQLDFFNGQAPDGIKSFGSALCMASMSIGNYVSSMLVNIVMNVTTTKDNVGWIPDDLNTGHLHKFYFMIAGFAAVDFVIYVFCAKWYKGIINVLGSVNGEADLKGCPEEGTSKAKETKTGQKGPLRMAKC